MIKVVRSYRTSRPVVNHFVLLGVGLFVLTLFIFYAPRNQSPKPLRSSRVNLNKDHGNIQTIQTGNDVNQLKQQIQNLTLELMEERELVEELKETIAELEEKKSENGFVGAFSDLLSKKLGIGKNLEDENSNVCSAKKFYSSKSDIQMLKAYEQIPFDNVPGGVWTQGFDITYDPQKIKEEEVLEVFVVPHSHNDPGW
uniref:Alpha-mannosidase n=1 Tax=Panagrolaimus sp. JU765 TaxID=591449 RepID=A0AC34RH95_9BILA